MEFGQEFIDRRVGDVDLVEIVVLPKLLGIPQFDIDETFFQVMLQGATVDQEFLAKSSAPEPSPRCISDMTISFMPASWSTV